MPELPEVQTIIDDLNRKIKGDRVVSFWSDWGKAIKGQSAEEFKKAIRGRKIERARRIGKNIFIDLSGGKTLYIHLKMTGHLLVKDQKTVNNGQYFKERVNQYVHHIWYLKNQKSKIKNQNDNAKLKNQFNVEKYDKTLEFSDLRKFGKIVLDDTEKISNRKEIKALGIDAMDAKFTYEKFEEILTRKPGAKIGLLLMDQNTISGIGNIYRSEILFESGVLPGREVKNLSEKEKKLIFRNIKKVLAKAIKYRGTSDSDYRDTSGAPGGFQRIMKVYNQEKRKCKKCGTIIKRYAFGQRSVFVCSKCQL